MQSEIKGYCARCKKKTNCCIPCAFVESILSDGNPGIYERCDNRNGLTILYPVANDKEIRETTIRSAGRDKAYQHKVDGLFSTDSENPFASYQPKLRQTDVFILKVLLGYSYEEIAFRLDSTVDNVHKIYHKAKTRILKALDLLDQHQNALDMADHALKVNGEATGKLPKYQRWFLMNKALGLTPAQIAEIEGTTRRVVSPKIRYCYDRLIAGELTLFEVAPAEIEAARERMEKKRARDRG